MKFAISHCRLPPQAAPRRVVDCRLPGARQRRLGVSIGKQQSPIGNVAGFTMMEVALCLAIIGFALVSILLVLPLGMNNQRDTREETIVNQDATMLMEAIHNGSRGMDDLTNFVFAITNYYQGYNAKGQPNSKVFAAGYTYNSGAIDNSYKSYMNISNGLHIIGILSTPEFTVSTGPANALVPGGQPVLNLVGNAYTSNHVYAYVRSFSGLAVEKPPQNNPIMQENTFSYRVLCVNAPVAMDTNIWSNTDSRYANSMYARDLAGNLRELRLLFSWPLKPNSDVGFSRQNYRTEIAGGLTLTNEPVGMPLYFYQSQNFTTNLP